MQYAETVPDARRSARLGFLLSQLGSYAGSMFAELTEPLGVSPSEAGVIRIIGRTPGISQRELADRLGLVQSRVVVLLDRLDEAGLSTRTRRDGDRRVQEVRLTDAGTALLGKLRSAAEEQERRLTEGLDAEARARLFALLSELVALRGLDADVHRETPRE